MNSETHVRLFLLLMAMISVLLVGCLSTKPPDDIPLNSSLLLRPFSKVYLDLDSTEFRVTQGGLAGMDRFVVRDLYYLLARVKNILTENGFHLTNDEDLAEGKISIRGKWISQTYSNRPWGSFVERKYGGAIDVSYYLPMWTVEWTRGSDVVYRHSYVPDWPYSMNTDKEYSLRDESYERLLNCVGGLKPTKSIDWKNEGSTDAAPRSSYLEFVGTWKSGQTAQRLRFTSQNGEIQIESWYTYDDEKFTISVIKEDGNTLSATFFVPSTHYRKKSIFTKISPNEIREEYEGDSSGTIIWERN